MQSAEIFNALKERFADAVLAFDETVKSPFVVVAPDRAHDILQFLRDEPTLGFDYLQLVTAVDYPDRFTCVYHVYSYEHRHGIAIKADLPRENPSIRSAADIWPAADWHEREQYDLLGIRFEGHPNLRRILLPEDWEGYPLRKDYVPPTEYHGVDNTRTVGDQTYPAPDQDQKAIPPYKDPKPQTA